MSYNKEGTLMEVEGLKAIHLLSSEEKLKWGYGEWVEEADVIEFRYKGYLCWIRRNLAATGTLCGYVIIHPNHPWFDKHYDAIEADCHGGLTFSEVLFGTGEFAVGFDCGHSWDLLPIIEETQRRCDEYLLNESMKTPILKGVRLLKRTYKNISFAVEECKKLVDQAIEAEKQSQGENGNGKVR
jgi:hypothetical protein